MKRAGQCLVSRGESSARSGLKYVSVPRRLGGPPLKCSETNTRAGAARGDARGLLGGDVVAAAWVKEWRQRPIVFARHADRDVRGFKASLDAFGEVQCELVLAQSAAARAHVGGAVAGVEGHVHLRLLQEKQACQKSQEHASQGSSASRATQLAAMPRPGARHLRVAHTICCKKVADAVEFVTLVEMGEAVGWKSLTWCR